MADITRTEVNRVVRAARRIDPSVPAQPARHDAQRRSQAETEIPEQAARLRLAIVRTARRLRQSAGSELGASSIAALAMIEREGPVTPSELADAEVIKRPTATKIVSRLEAADLVERAADPADGRCSLISVTPTGRALLGEMRSRKDAYLAQQLENLPDRDVATLRRAAAILERMLEEGRT
jgi:DNA-binding MarR family transcriptional regulator